MLIFRKGRAGREGTSYMNTPPYLAPETRAIIKQE